MTGGAGEVESVEVFFQIRQASWDTHVNMSTLYHRVIIPNLTPWWLLHYKHMLLSATMQMNYLYHEEWYIPPPLYSFIGSSFFKNQDSSVSLTKAEHNWVWIRGLEADQYWTHWFLLYNNVHLSSRDFQLLVRNDCSNSFPCLRTNSEKGERDSIGSALLQRLTHMGTLYLLTASEFLSRL